MGNGDLAVSEGRLGFIFWPDYVIRHRAAANSSGSTPSSTCETDFRLCIYVVLGPAVRAIVNLERHKWLPIIMRLAGVAADIDSNGLISHLPGRRGRT